MPTKSTFPDVDIPNVDLWSFMFDQKRDFDDSQVIYRAATGSRQYTFSEVKAAAVAFGEGLQNLWDWQRGDVLGVYSPNDVDFGPLTYGVFFAGGIVSPANPAYSPDELAFQLSNAGAKAIATTVKFLPGAIEAAKKAGIPRDRIVLIGAEKDETHQFKHWTNIRKTSGALRYRRRKMNPAEDIAFLVYSSGTTGLPKGVMLTHRNIIADQCLIKGCVGHWYKSGADKMIGVLPFFHIYGLQGLVNQTLYRGIEMVVMPAFDLRKFLEIIQEHKITFVYVAPPVIVRLLRDPMVKEYDLSSVRMMTSGAAPLTKELVDAVYERFKIKINQAYGLSETSPMTHTQPWDEWSKSVGSVGKMFPNMTAKYVDPEGKELGPGETGELWLAGPNIFKGYWNNEEATRNSIVEEDGLRYFKTGDVGFQDKDGNFSITDRVKELIKYKGFQVAPAELEGKLMDHPLVNDVAVIGVEDKEQHTEVPRAYITGLPTQDTSKDAEEIVSWTQSKVASHKRLRGGVRFIDEIPKSASGKILRRLLKDRVKREDAREKPRL
ncbi:acetyl-CoA synthetase-like protein [Rhizodiscina lignyota]|uniref:Acetyl-CoA synthetase-like protein n=1 Tax=Rhizodiscina lignyota TaxID=1504668 RepID=A0A9P4M180_9PEZI|nr:acetyl-CoA synthetase-like protein [Rhizodiscina lignyota]